MMQTDEEFTWLFFVMNQSGCAKKQTACGTYVNGEWRYAVNFCEYQGDACPRIGMRSGTGYELCKANHAEANLAKAINGGKSEGVAWITGHYWACEPCASALKNIGVTELRIREFQRTFLAGVVLDEQEAKAKLEVLDILPPKGALWT